MNRNRMALKVFKLISNKQKVQYLLPKLSFALPLKECFPITTIDLTLSTSSLINTRHYSTLSKLNVFKNSAKNYRLGLGGSVLYENIVDKLNYSYFYKEFTMDDTFFSWFLITEVHVWMLMCRVMQEGDEDGHRLRNHIVEAMWNDVNIRAKKLNSANNSSLKSHLQLLSDQFNAAVIGYDEAIVSDDTVLANHIWRRIFKSENKNPEQLEKFIYYLRKQIHALNHTDNSQIFSIYPNINWIYV